MSESVRQKRRRRRQEVDAEELFKILWEKRQIEQKARELMVELWEDNPKNWPFHIDHAEYLAKKIVFREAALEAKIKELENELADHGKRKSKR